MTDLFSQELLVYLCCILSILVTLASKILPITFLDADALSPLLRRWLTFVPVAVMAALVGSDVFFYEGHFSLSTSNLYLMVSLPTILVAWYSKNYFLTIAVGLALIIAARAYGLP